MGTLNNILFGLGGMLGIIGIVGIITSIKDNLVTDWITLLGSTIFIAISLTLIKITMEHD